MKRWFVVLTVVVSLFAAGLTVWAAPKQLGSGPADSGVTINGAIRPKGIW